MVMRTGILYEHRTIFKIYNFKALPIVLKRQYLYKEGQKNTLSKIEKGILHHAIDELPMFISKAAEQQI